MNAFIDACIKANKEIYTYINQNLKAEDFHYNGSLGEGGDKSLNIDLYAESVFIKYLSSFGNIYSEESGLIQTTDTNQKNYRIIIDPLDGSDNFFSGLDYYGTSVALECNGLITIGVVCNLVSRLIYIRDENNSFMVSDFEGNVVKGIKPDYYKPKIAIVERSHASLAICEVLFKEHIKYRSPGAIALSMARAREYNFVLFCGNYREFDLCAALYICNDLHVYKGANFLLVSENKNIFSKLKNLLNNI